MSDLEWAKRTLNLFAVDYGGKDEAKALCIICDALEAFENFAAHNDYDSWCDVVGTTARPHYGDVPHSKLSEWYRSGVSIRGAVMLAHEYIREKQK